MSDVALPSLQPEKAVKKEAKPVWWRCPMNDCGFRYQKKNLRDLETPFRHVLDHAIVNEANLERALEQLKRLKRQYPVRL